MSTETTQHEAQLRDTADDLTDIDAISTELEHVKALIDVAKAVIHVGADLRGDSIDYTLHAALLKVERVIKAINRGSFSRIE